MYYDMFLCFRSIGFFAHSGAPGDFQIVHGATVNIDNLDEPEFVSFFQSISNSVLSPGEYIEKLIISII